MLVGARECLTREVAGVVRPLTAVEADQQRAFAELLEAQRRLEELSRAGSELSIVDGQTSAADQVLAAVHDAQHQLDALSAEALQSALNPEERS